jgi:hypothetical protein
MSTMPRTEVEQWALAVIKAGDTLSFDRMTKRNQVAEMCGVRAVEADRIIQWAGMMSARGEPLPFITMPGAVRAMKNHREKYASHFKALDRVQAERDALAKERQKKQASARQRRMTARRREAAVGTDTAPVESPAEIVPDYLLYRIDAHLRPVAPSVPMVVGIPKKTDPPSVRSSRNGFRLILSTLADGGYRAMAGTGLARIEGVSTDMLTYMAHRGLIAHTRGDTFSMTIAGLVFHTIASGSEPWTRPTQTASAWQVVLRRIREGRRRMDKVSSVISAPTLPRHQRQMTRAGLIRVKDGNAYLTEYGWQWARMDLTTQG